MHRDIQIQILPNSQYLKSEVPGIDINTYVIYVALTTPLEFSQNTSNSILAFQEFQITCAIWCLGSFPQPHFSRAAFGNQCRENSDLDFAASRVPFVQLTNSEGVDCS